MHFLTQLRSTPSLGSFILPADMLKRFRQQQGNLWLRGMRHVASPSWRETSENSWVMAYSSLSGQVNKWTRVVIVPGLAYQSLGCPDVLYFGSSNPLMHFGNIRFYVFSEKVCLKEHLRRFKIINS